MASSVYDTGYEDELFQYPVGPSLHCCICTNVIKDPAMCHNEHIFCRACITRHLMNSHTCPTCMQALTVETLRQAPRGIRNLLSELQIRCKFFDRGCGKFVQPGDLQRHVADCGFAPAVCSNEGCQLEVNQQDLLHHEKVCELRRPECHSCNEIRREMDTVKANLAAVNVKLDRNDNDLQRIEENLKGNWKNLDRNEKKIAMIGENVKNTEENVKTVAAKVELVQQQLNKQEESNRRLEQDNVEMKKSLNAIMKQLERMTQQTPHGVQAEQMKKGSAEGGGMDREQKVVVSGGENLNSVEMFSFATGTWTPLQPMKHHREAASSVVHNNHIFVFFGCSHGQWFESMEKLSLNAVHGDHFIAWENIQLPGTLTGHRMVVYKGRVMVIGGYDRIKFTYCDSITEISLVSPYTSKLLATMPHQRYYHGVAIFGDKILIFGGKANVSPYSGLRSVIMYDIIKKHCHELSPLPYPVHDMATVKWGDENVMIMGGVDRKGKPLNKVLMYNIKTQKSQELPDMKYNREACVAAVVRDTVIVMGGRDKRGNDLKSVEGFRFDRNSWEELPPMHEARWQATAVVC